MSCGCAAGAVPDHWYNVNVDFPELREPLLDPSTGQPVGAAAMEELFVPELVEQELDDRRRYVPIPEEILGRYASWRPSPLLRARALEEALGTRCRIFFKYEGASPIGSHKANSGLAQAYFSKRAGRKRLFAETGAGQWGSAISMGAGFSGIACDVFMVGNSYDAKSARRVLMETFGSTVHRSPSPLTAAGRALHDKQPDHPGSLGLAIAEAIEATRADRGAAYALGSAFGFVCLHQTVIGQELRGQLARAEIRPDALISCIGGGSSFAGLVFPFLEDVRRGRAIELIAVESNAVPKVTQGRYAYDFGDTSGQTPLIKMFTLGHKFAPPEIHSGGLRYHGLAAQVSKLIHLGLARAEAYAQLDVYEAAKLFATREGIIPAPEAAHSIAAACAYARKHQHEEKTVVFCLTGHGFFDLAGYDKFNRGQMPESETPRAAIEAALAKSITPTPPPAPTAAPFDAWRERHRAATTPAAPASPARTAATAPSADLSALAVVTEAAIKSATGTGPILVSAKAVVTPAAATEARARHRAIVRSEARR
jgi:tryptophan synthase beta chain